jgi:hypothetical protein
MEVTIHCNREKGCGDTLHNKKNKSIWKAKISKKIFQELPLDRVKGLFKIHFQQTAGRRTLSAILPKEFLERINIVTHKLTSQESILHGTNNVR